MPVNKCSNPNCPGFGKDMIGNLCSYCYCKQCMKDKEYGGKCHDCPKLQAS